MTKYRKYKTFLPRAFQHFTSNKLKPHKTSWVCKVNRNSVFTNSDFKNHNILVLVLTYFNSR